MAASVVVPPRVEARFIAGQGISFVGTEVTAFALPLIAVISLDATPITMAWLTAASTVPHALSPFFAGPLVDGNSKRTVMVWSDLLRAGLVASIPVFFAMGILSVWLLALIGFLLGMLSVLFDAAVFSFVPQIAPPSRLVRFNGHLEALRSGAQTVGPGVAGVLVGVIGGPLTLLIDMVSFLVSAVTVGLTRVPDPKPERDESGVRGYLATVRSGFTTVWSSPVLRLLGLGSGAYNLFFAGSVTVIAIFVIRFLGLSPAQYGLALAVGCLGGLASGVLAERIGDRLGLRLTFCVGLGSASVCGVLVGLAPRTVWLALVVLIIAELIGSFGSTLYVVSNASVRQLIVPAEMRGRVYATMRLLNRSAMPLGALLGGWLGTVTTVRTAVVVAGLGQVLTTLVFIALRGLIPKRPEDAQSAAGGAGA